MNRAWIAISLVLAIGLSTGCTDRMAQAQHQADEWCRNANHDPGAKFYGNPQFLCAAADGTWARFQPDGQLISDGGSTFISPLGTLDMSGDVRAAKNWCAKANEDRDDGMYMSAYVPGGGNYDEKTGKCVDSNGKPLYWQPEKRLLDAKEKIIPPFNTQTMFPSGVSAVGDPAVPKPVYAEDRADIWCQNANSNPKADYSQDHDQCIDGGSLKLLRYQPSDRLLNNHAWDGDNAKPVDCGDKKNLGYVQRETTCSSD
jgi:hypothetical protein